MFIYILATFLTNADLNNLVTAHPALSVVSTRVVVGPTFHQRLQGIFESPFELPVDRFHIAIFFPLLNDPVRPIDVSGWFTHGTVGAVYRTVWIEDAQSCLVIAGGDAECVVDDGDLTWMDGGFTDETVQDILF